jgi:hypothetical protein
MTSFSRRLLAGFGLALFLSAGAVQFAHAQDDQSSPGEEKDKKDDEWGDRDLHLKKLKAEGPCPYVKVLYDAARYHEFKDNKESASAAQWTGEINGVNSDCAYKGTEPIQVATAIGFSLGRGPEAEGQTKVYHYWIAVTERDKTVLAKQEFDLPITFAEGEQRRDVTVKIENIQIPRADIQVSGENFEVLVGFDVTPEMADFNREGKHFRYVNASTSK